MCDLLWSGENFMRSCPAFIACSLVLSYSEIAENDSLSIMLSLILSLLFLPALLLPSIILSFLYPLHVFSHAIYIPDPLEDFGSEKNAEHFSHNSVRGCSYFYRYCVANLLGSLY